MENLIRILKLLACSVLTTVFMGCSSIHNHVNSGQHDEDSVITTKVKAAILDVNTLQVYVTSHKGVVLLRGFVDSSQRVTKVGDAARSIENVVSVENDLVVNCAAVSEKCENPSGDVFINALR